jgi:hypothetical protein
MTDAFVLGSVRTPFARYGIRCRISGSMICSG